MLQDLRHLDDVGEFGKVTLEELKKAIDTGSYTYGTSAPGALTGGAAMQVEFLDSALRSVTVKERNMKLWKDIAKQKADAVVVQYNLQQSHGEDRPEFFADGGVASASDAEYSREIEKVKFLGTLRAVTHPQTLVKQAHGPAIAREIKNGTKYLLEKLERRLFDASSSINALEFDGIDAQIRAKSVDSEYQGKYAGIVLDDDMVYDKRGAGIDEDDLEEIAYRIASNAGVPEVLYLSLGAHRDLNKLFFPKKRLVDVSFPEGRSGFVLKKFDSAAGDFEIKGDLFLRPFVKSVTGTGNAPGATTGATDSAEAVSSEWTTAEQATYIYQVSAVYSASGESPALTTAGYVKANNNNVDVDWSAPAPPAGETILFYKVFRSAAGGAAATARLISRVASGTVTLRDTNAFLPGDSSAYLLEMQPETISWFQLMPMMKWDLARINTSYRWMQMIYGTPVVSIPRHNCIVENIDE